MARTRLVDLVDVVVPQGRRALRSIEDLARSIQQVGLLQPIVVTTEMTLVAGLHRLRACEALGWAKVPASIVSLDAIAIEAATIDENVVRHELTVLERGELLRRRKELHEVLHPETRRGVAGGIASGAARRGERTTDRMSPVQDIAAKTGRSRRSVEREIRIATAIPQDVRDALRVVPMANDLLNLGRLAGLDETEQRAVAARIVRGDARSVEHALKLVTSDRIRRRRSPWPSGKYDVIVVDPPWRYEAERIPYPTMTLEDIQRLPVPDIAADDSTLWLWTTNSQMRHAYSCLDAWGFTERTILTWDKDRRSGTGKFLIGVTEHVILATKGTPTFCVTTQTTILRAPSGRHSEKPSAFYSLVEQLCPSRRRIDLFARRPRSGWATWGDLPGRRAG